MSPDTSLVRRFAFGENDVSLYLPGTPQYDFFIGVPQSLRSLAETNRGILKTMRATCETSLQPGQSHSLAFREIRFQIQGIEERLASGFRRVSDAVTHLEDTLGVYLAEFKWVMGQLDAKLAELVNLVKFPRQTEARELIEDGVKALAAGHLDDAETCLSEAIQRKRTSFEGHTNLGFLYLHKEDAPSALRHFQKAVDYAPVGPATKIHALENLARAQFAAREFHAAQRTMAPAIQLRKDCNLPSPTSRYHYAKYLALAGEIDQAVAELLSICRISPVFFPVAVADKDLEPHRERILDALDALARNENEKAAELLHTLRRRLDEWIDELPFRDRIDDEIRLLRSAVDSMASLVSTGVFSDSRQAIALADRIEDNLEDLADLGRARQAVLDCLDAEALTEDYPDRAEPDSPRIGTRYDNALPEMTRLREEEEKAQRLRTRLGVLIPALLLVAAGILWFARETELAGGGSWVNLAVPILAFLAVVLGVTGLTVGTMRTILCQERRRKQVDLWQSRQTRKLQARERLAEARKRARAIEIKAADCLAPLRSQLETLGEASRPH